jgi:hypothetical protein
VLFECKAPYALLLVLQTASSSSSSSSSSFNGGVIKYAAMATLAISQLDQNLVALSELHQQTSHQGGEALDTCKIIASILMTFRSDSAVVSLVLELVLLVGGLVRSKAQVSAARRRSSVSSREITQSLLLSAQPHLLADNSLLISLEAVPQHLTFVNRSKLLQLQLHVLVQDMMEFHVSDIPILTLGCECLAMLASDDVGAKAIGEDEEVCGVVCSVLRASLSKEQHLEAIASRAIGNIARFTVNSVILADCGVCEMLVASLRAYYTISAAHVRDVCLSMAHVCRFNLLNKITLATSGACKLVHECFILHISNEVVIPAVMYAIVSLSHQNKYNLQQFSAMGLTDFILELYIGSDLASPKDEAMAAMVLWIIGHVPPTSAEMLSSPEVCKFALSSIYTRSDPATVAYGCKAVAALALCPSKHNHKLLVELQVIEVLQELCAVSFRQNEAVLTNSLLALASLVHGVARFQDRVSVAGVVAVMEDNYVSRPVIEAALTALLSVFSGVPTIKCAESNRKVLTSPVTLKIILDCVRHHITAEPVAALGCQLVTLLCTKFKHIHKELVEFGVCGLVVDAFRVHKRCLRVLHQACAGALSVAQLGAGSASALCELGLISTLSSLLRNYASKETLVSSVCEVAAAVLQQLGARWAGMVGGSSSQHLSELSAAGFPQAIVETLQMYAAAGVFGREGAAAVLQGSVSDVMSEGGDEEGMASPRAGVVHSGSRIPRQESPHRRKILEHAIEMVGSMASMDSGLCSELEAAGVCECMLLLLMKSRADTDSDGGVLKATLVALQHLARCTDMRLRLLDIEVLGHIDQAMSARSISTSSTCSSDDALALALALTKTAKKTKALLLGQTFLQRNIGLPF